MIDLQSLVDAMSRAGQNARSDYHLTLGKAIRSLAEIAPSTPVKFDTGFHPGSADSYRGYYSDLALAPEGSLDSVGKLLEELRQALGATFEGYKGGDFVMGDKTPLWMASYGTTGGARALMDVRMIDGTAVVGTKALEDE